MPLSDVLCSSARACAFILMNSKVVRVCARVFVFLTCAKTNCVYCARNTTKSLETKGVRFLMNNLTKVRVHALPSDKLLVDGNIIKAHIRDATAYCVFSVQFIE